MTPANPDALAEALARELARLDGWQDPDALWTDNLGIIARGGEGSPVYLDYVEDADKLIAGPLAPLLADLQQQAASISSLEESVNSLEADLQRVTAERDADQAEHARYRASAEEMWETAKRHGGQMLAEKRRADAAEARAAQLQAEVEALKGALTEIRDHPESYRDRQCSYAVGWAFYNVQCIARRALATSGAMTREIHTPVIDVQPMRLSGGKSDYFVRVRCGDRECTPFKFCWRWKAEYEADHFRWLFGLRSDKPDLMAYDELSHPND